MYITKENINSIHKAMSQKDYSLAITLINEYQNRGVESAHLYVAKAQAIMLSDSEELSLDDAKLSLENALLLDPESIEALQEMGFFYFSVLNDPSGAVSYFEKVIGLSKSNIREAIVAAAQCYAEVHSKDFALEYFEKNILLDDEKVRIHLESVL